MNEKVGDFINRKRTEKAITLRKFADQIGISPSFLSDIENGNRPFPSTEKGERMSQAIIDRLELSPSEKEEFIRLRDDSMIAHNRIGEDTLAYLRSAPMAQAALRQAKESNLADSDWEKILEEIRKKGK